MSMDAGKLGKIFVKYVEPIDLNEYVEKYISSVPADNTKNKLDLSPTDFESLSMKLTKDLYLIQQREQPITMNSIIASSLLYHQQP